LCVGSTQGEGEQYIRGEGEGKEDGSVFIVFNPPKNTMPLFFTTPQKMKALVRQLINKLV